MLITICARCGWELHEDFGWVDTYGDPNCGGKPHEPSKGVIKSLPKSA